MADKISLTVDYRPTQNLHHNRGLGMFVSQLTQSIIDPDIQIQKLSQIKNIGNYYSFRFGCHNKLCRILTRLNPWLDYSSKFKQIEADFFLATDFNFYPSPHQFKNILSILYDTHAFDQGEHINLWLKKSFLNLKTHAGFFAISEYSKQCFIKEFDLLPSKIQVTYPGYNPNIYNIHIPTLLREEINTLQSYSLEKYFLYVGGSNPNKNIPRLIEAFYKLQHQYPDIKLVLVGREHFYNKKHLSLIKNLKLTKSIILTGYLSQDLTKHLYQKATAFIFPSIKEGFGLPVLEAMACACPVITANTTSLPEVGGNAVHYITPTNVNEIYEAMKLFLEDSKLQNQYKSLGLEQCKKFSWQTTSQIIIQKIKELR